MTAPTQVPTPTTYAASPSDHNSTFDRTGRGSFLAPGRVADSSTRGDTGEDGTSSPFATASVVGSTVLSVGFVSWLLRTGVLASSMMATAPLWNRLDLLPILANGRKEDEEHDNDRKERLTAARDRRERALRKLFGNGSPRTPADGDKRAG
jgi:hypothetical protein